MKHCPAGLRFDSDRFFFIFNVMPLKATLLLQGHTEVDLFAAGKILVIFDIYRETFQLSRIVNWSRTKLYTCRSNCLQMLQKFNLLSLTAL